MDVMGGVERLPMLGEIVGFAGHEGTRESGEDRRSRSGTLGRSRPLKSGGNGLRVIADAGAENEERALAGHGRNLTRPGIGVTRGSEPAADLGRVAVEA